MKYVLGLLLFTWISLGGSFAQTINGIDFTDIKSKISDKDSDTYYPRLIDRLKNLDTTLTQNELFLLYYGAVFQTSYNPYMESKSEKKFQELMKGRNVPKIIKAGEKVLKENPVNLRVMYYLALLHLSAQSKEKGADYAKLGLGMIGCVLSTGNGASVETSIVVTRVTDEYTILESLELTSAGQTLIQDGPTDKLSISTTNQIPDSGGNMLTELYFNIYWPWNSLTNLLKEGK